MDNSGLFTVFLIGVMTVGFCYLALTAGGLIALPKIVPNNGPNNSSLGAVAAVWAVFGSGMVLHYRLGSAALKRILAAELIFAVILGGATAVITA